MRRPIGPIRDQLRALTSVSGLMSGWLASSSDERRVPVVLEQSAVLAWGMLDFETLDGCGAGSSAFAGVFVHPEHRRRGLGKAVAVRLLQEARDRCIERLWFDRQTEASRRLWLHAVAVVPAPVVRTEVTQDQMLGLVTLRAA